MAISSSNYRIIQTVCLNHMYMLEHSKRKFLILKSKLVNYQNRINVIKISVGKSKQYYILTAELVDPNYL